MAGADVIEVAFDDWVVRLDGNVLELLHARVQPTQRHHVSHVVVEAEPRRGGMRLTIGHESGGMVIGQKVDVPGAYWDRIQALFAESRRRRDALGR